MELILQFLKLYLLISWKEVSKWVYCNHVNIAVPNTANVFYLSKCKSIALVNVSQFFTCCITYVLFFFVLYFVFGDSNLSHMYETHGIFWLYSLFVLMLYFICCSMTINLIWFDLIWCIRDQCYIYSATKLSWSNSKYSLWHNASFWNPGSSIATGMD